MCPKARTRFDVGYSLLAGRPPIYRFRHLAVRAPPRPIFQLRRRWRTQTGGRRRRILHTARPALRLDATMAVRVRHIRPYRHRPPPLPRRRLVRHPAPRPRNFRQRVRVAPQNPICRHHPANRRRVATCPQQPFFLSLPQRQCVYPVRPDILRRRLLFGVSKRKAGNFAVFIWPFERAKAACTLTLGSAGCLYHFDFNALYIDVSNRTPPPDNVLRKFCGRHQLCLAQNTAGRVRRSGVGTGGAGGYGAWLASKKLLKYGKFTGSGGV